MRKSKKITINSKEITVKELSVKDILELTEGNNIKTDSGLMDIVNTILPKSLDGVGVEELREMYPSEIKEIYDVFKEVNEVFFAILASPTLQPVISALKAEIIRAMARDFQTSFAD